MEQTTEMNYAGFGIRFLAFILDSIWMFGILYTVLYLIKGNVFSLTSQYSATQFFFEYIMPVIITVGFWFFKSATPGKMVLKLEVVDVNTGGKVPTGRLLIRYLGYYVGIIPLFLGFFWIIWDKKKQGWYDKMSGTAVIVLD